MHKLIHVCGFLFHISRRKSHGRIKCVLYYVLYYTKCSISIHTPIYFCSFYICYLFPAKLIARHCKEAVCRCTIVIKYFTKDIFTRTVVYFCSLLLFTSPFPAPYPYFSPEGVLHHKIHCVSPFAWLQTPTAFHPLICLFPAEHAEGGSSRQGRRSDR